MDDRTNFFVGRGIARATRPTVVMTRVATIVCDFVFRFSPTGSADVTA